MPQVPQNVSTDRLDASMAKSEQHLGFRLTVNGDGFWWNNPSIRYTDVVRLSGMRGDLAVSWSAQRFSDTAANCLLPGDFLVLKPGIYFSVTDTGDA